MTSGNEMGRDEDIALRAYAELPRALPPPEIEARVLAAAHAINPAGSRRRSLRWTSRLATAAVAVLAFGLSWRAIEFQTRTPIAAPDSAAAPTMRPAFEEGDSPAKPKSRAAMTDRYEPSPTPSSRDASLPAEPGRAAPEPMSPAANSPATSAGAAENANRRERQAPPRSAARPFPGATGEAEADAEAGSGVGVTLGRGNAAPGTDARAGAEAAEAETATDAAALGTALGAADEESLPTLKSAAEVQSAARPSGRFADGPLDKEIPGQDLPRADPAPPLATPPPSDSLPERKQESRAAPAALGETPVTPVDQRNVDPVSVDSIEDASTSLEAALIAVRAARARGDNEHARALLDAIARMHGARSIPQDLQTLLR